MQSSFKQPTTAPVPEAEVRRERSITITMHLKIPLVNVSTFFHIVARKKRKLSLKESGVVVVGVTLPLASFRTNCGQSWT